MKRVNVLLFSLFVILTVLISCKKIFPQAPEPSATLDGPMEGLTDAERQRFLNGELAFNEVFSTATGLGPTFVSTSCVSCHAGDGKGHPFTTLTRFGQVDATGNQFLDQGGPQLQNRAIPGFHPESIPAGATSARFLPPAVAGLGFLEYVTDADILAMADPNDSDGDGISGTPNWTDIPSFVTLRTGTITQNGKYICRFGKKAGAYDLLHQTVNAYNQDMGVVSTYVPKDPYTGHDQDPEVSNQKVLDLVFYQQTLKAPSQRNASDQQVQRGKQLFGEINCAACHKPSLKTGYAPVAALSYKNFAPYTDLLLHDMGAELDDGYTEGGATTAEWRTPPLWGLGLSKDAQGGSYFLLHDGRATSIEAAILLHGGEGAASRAAYKNLSEADKKALITFLESL